MVLSGWLDYCTRLSTPQPRGRQTPLERLTRAQEQRPRVLRLRRHLLLVFLGNSGSQAVALVISTLLLFGLMPVSPKSAVPRVALLLPLAWPLLDLGFVVCARLRRGRAPWRGGRDHTTHLLARLLGSDGRAASSVALVAATGYVLAWWLLRGSR